MPEVTVGMPTYNRAEYLKISIPLVLNQSFTDFEFIICDDCSADNTTEVVKSFTDPRIKYFRNEKNLNIPGNLNRILELAKGEYIVILHDHDVFDPQLIEKMYCILQENPEVGFVHPGVATINPDGTNRKELLGDFPEIMDGKELADRILLSDGFGSPVCACGLVRRSAFEEAGFFYDPSFGFVSDVDLWLRLSMKFKVGYIKEPVLTCTARDEGHVFYTVNWNLVGWLVNLFHKNIERRFNNDKEPLGKAMKIWEWKKEKFYRTSLLKTLIDNNYASFKEGMNIIKNDSVSLSNNAFILLKTRPVFFIFSELFNLINTFRKKLR